MNATHDLTIRGFVHCSHNYLLQVIDNVTCLVKKSMNTTITT